MTEATQVNLMQAVQSTLGALANNQNIDKAAIGLTTKPALDTETKRKTAQLLCDLRALGPVIAQDPDIQTTLRNLDAQFRLQTIPDKVAPLLDQIKNFSDALAPSGILTAPAGLDDAIATVKTAAADLVNLFKGVSVSRVNADQVAVHEGMHHNFAKLTLPCRDPNETVSFTPAKNSRDDRSYLFTPKPTELHAVQKDNSGFKDILDGL